MEKPQAQGNQNSTGRAIIVHFPLPGLLPVGGILALHTEVHILSLLGKGPELLEQQQLSESEACVLRPILEAFPYYCPYEVLLVSCSLASARQESKNKCISPPLQETRNQETRNQMKWDQELKPIRRAISSLRNKLRVFHLEISIVRERGCSLTRLSSQR